MNNRKKDFKGNVPGEKTVKCMVSLLLSVLEGDVVYKCLWAEDRRTKVITAHVAIPYHSSGEIKYSLLPKINPL